ncbi:MAG: hypothetical protein JKY18_06250 [Flavobacteriales bacterium]|nr:hypothetical protein [Flavobacteriales bacterium]
MTHLDIRIKLLLILAISVIVFWAANLVVSLSLLLALLAIWFLSGLNIKELKPVGRIKWFVLAIIFFHSYFSFDRDILLFTLFNWAFAISREGLSQGVLMGSNVLVMILITALVRKTSKPEELLNGLQKLGMSIDQATVLDAVLEVVEIKKGRKKNRRKDDKKTGRGKWKLRDIIRGKIEFLVEMVNQRMDEAKSKFKNSHLAIIVTFTTVISLIRFIKVAPGLPIAPGHKNVLIMPLFINAVKLSQKRFTATNLGFLSGLINFLAGFGKYGPLGPLQFMIPGIVIDLLAPIFRNSNSIFIYGLVGFVAGASRVAAEISLAYLVGMPQEFYLVYLPFIISQCSFGMLSAPVSKFLSNHLNRV